MDNLFIFLNKLIGVKYTYTEESNTKEYVENNISPFYANSGTINEMDLNFIVENGINCAGLCNLCRKFFNLPIPTYKNLYGGTEAYFIHFNYFLEEINFNKNYPDGSLLLYDYNPIDQGHLAIVMDEFNVDKIIVDKKILESGEKKLRNQKIIHSKGWHQNDCGFKVVHEVLSEDKENLKKYTHICLPKNWLKL
jgi:hypothetical protein